MIEVKKLVLKEIIPQDELQAWRRNIKKVEDAHCPIEVRQFIEALAAKLPDFGQVGKFNTLITGYELMLANVKELNGKKINTWEVYDLPVPRMVAIDNEATMYRLYNRKGKSGLIDYCKARVKGTELERLLSILNIHVFKQERPEFKKVMDEIISSKKLDA